MRIISVGALPVLAGFFLAAILLALLAFLLVRLGTAVFAHVERIEKIVDCVAEARLVLDQPLQAIEIASGAILDQRPPQIDDFFRCRRRSLARQPFAYHERDRFLDRRIGAIGDFVELAAMETVIEHGRQILGDARHPPCPDGLHAGLLDRVEYRACLLSAGHQLAMDHRIVTGELECNGVGMAAHDRGIRSAQLSRRLRQARLAADDAGPLRREGDFELGFARDRAQAPGDRALERLGRRLLRGIPRLDVGRHPGAQLSATFTDDSGSSTPKQR